MWLLPCSFCHSVTLHSVIHTAQPPHARAVLHSSVPLHFTSSFRPAFAFSNARSKQKLRQPCGKAVGSRSPHCVPGYPRLPPSLHSQTARASPLRWQKNYSAIAPLVFYRFVPAQGCFTCFRFKSCFAHTQPPTTHP